MDLQFRKICARDSEWHEAFHRYIQRVFPRVSFRRWCEYGGWTDEYVAFALTSGQEIVGNASLQRMNVVVNGCDLTGWQLGAVGTTPEWRGRGLQRRILSEVLQVPKAADLVFLFANPSVVDFYPRFGFRRVKTSAFIVEHRVEKASQELTRLTIERPEHRTLFKRVAAAAQPVTSVFGARSYSSIALWYWTNFNRDHFYYSEENDAILVTEQEGDLLRILDVLAPDPIDLSMCLPHLIQSSISHIEFGFTPELLWPTARSIPLQSSDEESPLFILEGGVLPEKPFSFPALAHT